MSAEVAEANDAHQLGEAFRDWETVTLADVSIESRHRNGAQLDDSLLCGVLKTAGLVPMRERVKGNSTDRCKLVPVNAFAYNPMRLNIGSIARNKVQHPVMVSPDYVVFEVVSQRLLPEYLDHFRYSHAWQTFVGTSGDGSVRVRIYYDHLSQLKLPLPPLPEQQKIAAILTAVDDKLDVIARQIEATQTLKRGLMQTLFSRGVGTQDADGRWVPHTEFKDSELGEIPAGWTVTTVGDVCEVKGGKRLPKGETLTEENTGYPYIRVTDMYMGGVDTKGILYVPSHIQPSIARYTISKDDIFITVAGTLGIVGIVPAELDGANLTENADKLTSIKIHRDYLFYCLCSEAIQDAIAREATSNAQPKLALTRIREFAIPLPTDAEQAHIGTILAASDWKLKLLSEKREKFQALKRGLMQKLLTGEWRVKTDEIL
ncbi:restriction endonuclease subunit S [Chromobacterium haemolyticum]|uniref:restriction endonuclease subunit S n=1 Tax=Chromobacterium haemolyticum TaxID=394935 RepID=UPI000694A368|nr:restriction endonuclease subunit S [Chromobacterium haemolyticum]